MVTGIKEPHLFNAGSNPLKVIRNLEGIISAQEIQKIRDELISNVISLYRLGESHYSFATSISNQHWRQRISRLYYGAYNARRALMLRHDGSFSTDSSDHKNVFQMPNDLTDYGIYKVKLVNLREDRNLADYNHLANEGDLLAPAQEYSELVGKFLIHVKTYLIERGVDL